MSSDTWVDVCFWLSESLRWKSVHLTVDSLSLWINVKFLLQCLLCESHSLSSSEDLGFLNKGLLQLSWLWIESVIISPLLIKLLLFV